jgi:anti-anti-sigma factor
MILTIENERLDADTSLVTLRGRLLLGNACAELESQILRLVGRGAKTLIFDLRGVTHMDSTGMGRFIEAHRVLTSIGGKIRLVAGAGGVRDMFQVTRLDTILPFYTTLEEARAAG